MKKSERQVRTTEALVEAFTEHRLLLLKIANSYVQDTAAAEDILQDAIARILEMKHTSEVDNPKSYLITAVRNRALNHLASYEKKNSVKVDDFVISTVLHDIPLQDTVIEDRDRFKAFIAAYETLPPQCRRALLLTKYHGLTLKQTATSMGIAPSTVEKHLAKALRRCAQYLVDSGHE